MLTTYCSKCGKEKKTQTHHIVYGVVKGTNTEITSRLCLKCHAVITGINATASRVVHSSVSDSVRVLLWKWFLNSAERITKEMIADRLGFKLYRFTQGDLQFISKARERVINFRGGKRKRSKKK
jgi:hypothetical protein